MKPRRILYLDLIGGAAGDMLMAALIDAGAPLDEVRSEIAKLDLEDVRVESVHVKSAGLSARRIDVLVRGAQADGMGTSTDVPDALADGASAPHGHEDVQACGHSIGDTHAHSHGHPHDHQDAHRHERLKAPLHDGHHDHLNHYQHEHLHDDLCERSPVRSRERPHRSYLDVRRIIATRDLRPEVRDLASRVFHRLAEAESAAHGVPLDQVVFHEVGADDAMADVVGVAAALTLLGVDEVVVSPVPLGRGLVFGAHGPVPVPAPATLAILRGAPLAQTGLLGETVTPTGAALLREIATRFGSIPSMIVDGVGVGAGHRSWPDRPNVVRALVGRGTDLATEKVSEDCIVEANIDDMSLELFPDLELALFEAGAIDVWAIPIHMKKGRVGLLVSALGRQSQEAALIEAYFVHSTTLGVRIREVERVRAPRRVVEVDTPFGRVRVKLADRPGGHRLVSPEHDDCARLAREARVSVLCVMDAAREAVGLISTPTPTRG